MFKDLPNKTCPVIPFPHLQLPTKAWIPKSLSPKFYSCLHRHPTALVRNLSLVLSGGQTSLLETVLLQYVLEGGDSHQSLAPKDGHWLEDHHSDPGPGASIFRQNLKTTGVHLAIFAYCPVHGCHKIAYLWREKKVTRVSRICQNCLISAEFG